MPEPEIEAKPLPTNEYSGPFYRTLLNDGEGHWYIGKEYGAADLYVWADPKTGLACAEPYPPTAWPEPLPERIQGIRAVWTSY